MEFTALKYFGRFIVIIFIQIMILNHIYFGGYITPYIYPLFILMMPFSIKGWVLLVVAFFSGLTMDMFSNTPGMHSSATVLIAFLRPAVINFISTKKEFETSTEPSFSVMGKTGVFFYVLILIFVHHFSMFLLETFRLDEIGAVFMRSLFSTIASVVVIMLAFLFSGRTKKVRI